MSHQSATQYSKCFWDNKKIVQVIIFVEILNFFDKQVDIWPLILESEEGANFQWRCGHELTFIPVIQSE